MMMEQIAAEMLAQIKENTFRPFHLIYRRVGRTWVRLCRNTDSNSYPMSLSIDSIDNEPVDRDTVYDWAIAFGAPVDVELFHYHQGANWFASWNIAPETPQDTAQAPQVN